MLGLAVLVAPNLADDISRLPAGILFPWELTERAPGRATRGLALGSSEASVGTLGI
jgi:hypothetical protein